MTGANSFSDEMALSQQYATQRDGGSSDLDSALFPAAGMRGQAGLSLHERDMTVPEFVTTLGLIGAIATYNGLAYIADKAATVTSGALSNIQGGALNTK